MQQLWKFRHNIKFKYITVLRGTDIIMQNIPHIQTEWWNIPYNTGGPT